jgi:hypothetical protein
MDGLEGEQLQEIGRDLTAMYAASRTIPLRIGIVRAGALQIAGPFATRAKLQAALQEMRGMLNEPATATPASPATVTAPATLSPIEFLVANAAQMGGDWSTLYLTGNLGLRDPITDDFESAGVIRAMAKQRVRVFAVTSDSESVTWRNIAAATGGAVLNQLTAAAGAGNSFLEVGWDAGSLPHGFRLYKARIVDGAGAKLAELPEIVASADPLPATASYLELRKTAADAAAKAATLNGLDKDGAAAIRELLGKAFAINARDEQALRTAAALYERLSDFTTAATLYEELTEAAPLDGMAFVSLGKCEFHNNRPDPAERALLKGRELGAAASAGSEELARIHLGRGDRKGSLPYLAEALAGSAQRQDLWFLQAEAAGAAGNRELTIQSYERGIALGGDTVKERSALIAVYIAAGAREKALAHVRAVTSNPPADAQLRAVFAGYLETLHQPDEALGAWRKVIEIDRANEGAFYHTARLLLNKADARGALDATAAALDAGAASARIYLARGDALLALNDVYQRRAVLREGAQRFPDPELLRTSAELEDQFLGGAPGAWRALVESIEKVPATPGAAPSAAPDAVAYSIKDALRRGMSAAVRDNDTAHVEWFSKRLVDAGETAFVSALTRPSSERREFLIVPGGGDALAFVVRGKEKQSPDRFLAEYCRTIAEHVLREGPADWKRTAASLDNYFRTLSELEPLGTRKGDNLEIMLSMRDKQAKKLTEKVLDILAIKLKSSHGETTVEQSSGESKAKQHEIVAAMAVDEIGIADALSKGNAFPLEIPFEKTPVYPSESMWRDAFYSKDKFYGGFVEAAVRYPKMAELYAALSILDRPTIELLTQAIPLNVMAEKHADLLFRTSSAFAVRNGRVVVPGGSAAEGVWTSAVGVSPRSPADFFRALVDKDNGRLLSFYAMISDLDPERARFFTLNSSRTSQFYKAFLESPEAQSNARLTRESGFGEFMHMVPLDAEGHVDFPGSPEVWMVAQGNSKSDSHTANLLKKVGRTAAPDEEDLVLLRMARTHYQNNGKRTELDNFLAVVRIDEHRPEPLDEPSALMLAQNYGAFASLYPYFTTLTGLDREAFRSLFTLFERLDERHTVDTNIVLGQVHALLQLLSFEQRRGQIGGRTAAKLLSDLCVRFLGAATPAGYTLASANTVGALTAALPASISPTGATIDEKMKRSLLGSTENASYDLRRKEFDRVLEMQKAPKIDTLLRLQTAAAALTAGKPPEPEIDRIDRALGEIAAIEITKATKVKGKEKDLLESYEPAAARKVLAEMRKTAARKKPSSGEFNKLADSLMAEINPQYTLALSGLVYAWYLRPQDLVVSDDVLLLRKHEYFDFNTPIKEPIAPESEFHAQQEDQGSFFLGGFAQFAAASGHAAAAGMKAGKGVGASDVAAQISSVRDTSWDLLRQADVRTLALRVQVAREWVVGAATDPALSESLSRNTLGLLSAARRAELFNAIEGRRWNKVWPAMTLSDLYALGTRYATEYSHDPWQSAAVTALRVSNLKNTDANVNLLGPVAGSLLGCDHPHLRVMPPYEHYENHLFPVDMAERTAEFKVYLAYAADGIGVDPSSLGIIAEPLAAETLGRVQMTDLNDWRSLTVAFAEIGPNAVQSAFEKNQ